MWVKVWGFWFFFFFKGTNERKLHFEETWCSLLLLLLLRDLEGPPFPSRCSVLSSLFYLVFVRRGFCFRKIFFFPGKVGEERERERGRSF